MDIDGQASNRETLVNREVRHSRRLAAVWPGEDFDEFYEPNAIWLGRRASAPATEGGRPFIEEMSGFWKSQEARMANSEVLEVRGDHLSLTRHEILTTAGDEFVTLLVGELGPTGRWSRVVAFDDTQLDEAIAELDARWAVDTDH